MHTARVTGKRGSDGTGHCGEGDGVGGGWTGNCTGERAIGYCAAHERRPVEFSATKAYDIDL